MTKRKLRKNAEINPPQSPHDGIHTCSRGCTKPGCNRTLRDTIEEQDAQIQALKQDLLEQTAAARHLRFERVHDINHIGGQQEEIEQLKKECQRLNSELHTCSCANANMHKYKEENARLKAEVERLTTLVESNLNKSKLAMAKSDASVHTLEAQVDALTKAGDVMLAEWASGDEKDAQNFLKALVIWNAAKEGKQP